MAVIHELMAGLRTHRQILDASRLHLSVESWDRFEDGKMLDDHGFNHMIRCNTSALGVYMPGCSLEERASSVGPSQQLQMETLAFWRGCRPGRTDPAPFGVRPVDFSGGAPLAFMVSTVHADPAPSIKFGGGCTFRQKANDLRRLEAAVDTGKLEVNDAGIGRQKPCHQVLPDLFS